jgi:dTDP-4-amino-4,6-dideoxygalactose transaminase
MSTVCYFPKGRFLAQRDFIHALVYHVGTSTEFILKEKCAELERSLAERLSVPEAIAVSSGTAALTLCLDALELWPGDEIVVPAFCFAGVTNAVVMAGAKPVFADCAAGSAVPGVNEIVACLSERTRAIVVAHLFSWLVDMPAVHSLARQRGIALIEDAAVAFGAEVGGKPAGTWGDLGVFSFFPVKPAGGIAEAGAIIGANAELRRKCRGLRNHGQFGGRRFYHEMVGKNCRMDEIAAGFLLRRLECVPEELRRRAAIAQRYSSRLKPLEPELTLPPTEGESGLNYVYLVQTDRREELGRYLSERGVETMTYYDPLPPLRLALQDTAIDPYALPNAIRIARRHIALPLYPQLSDLQVDHIIGAVEAFHA